MSRLKDWKLWIGSILSALLLYLAFRNVNTKEVLRAIKGADPYYISVSILITMLQHIIRTWRWKLILEPLKDTSFRTRFSSLLIGFGANCLLPARIGEIIRAYYLGTMEKISRVSALGTIVIERLFDGTTLLVVLILSLLLSPLSPKWVQFSGNIKTTGAVLLFLYIFLIVIFIILKRKKEGADKIFNKALFFLPKNGKHHALNGISNFILALNPSKDKKGFIQVVIWSLLLWITHLIQIKLVCESMGITLPFKGTFLILTMASFGVIVPSAPGFIGTFHFAVQTGLIILGVSRESALSSAILWHGVFYFPTIISALISFLIMPISIKEAREELITG